MNKATVESVMALAFELARIREQHGAQSGMYLSEVRALRAEVERLAAQAAPTEPPLLNITAKQLRAALDFVNPDVGDPDQLEAEVCIQWGEARDDGDGGTEPAGLRAWLAECPEEGSISLDLWGTEEPPAAQPSQAPVVQAVQTEVRFKYESMKPIDGYDAIYAEYATTFGRYPDDFMSKVVRQTKEDLFMWWGAHREKIRAGLVLLAAQEDASSGATAQAVRMLTDGEFEAACGRFHDPSKVRASIRKFCEVNAGCRIPELGKLEGGE